MSDKLPMTREQIEGEMGKCSIGAFSLPEHQFKAWVRFAEHILRIGTTELREENKRLTMEIDALRNVIAEGGVEVKF